MNVEPISKCLFELRNIGHVSEHAQFDLAVIGRNELLALFRDKRLTDLAALRGSDRDVLDVWLGGGQTARGGGRQRERGVDAARLLIDEAWQGVGVGGFQLAQLAPLYDFAWQLMALSGQIIQYGSGGRPSACLGFFATWQAHFAEQNFTQLLWRAQR